MNKIYRVIGLDNVAVVATKNGFLVANRTHAQKSAHIAAARCINKLFLF